MGSSAAYANIRLLMDWAIIAMLEQKLMRDGADAVALSEALVSYLFDQGHREIVRAYLNELDVPDPTTAEVERLKKEVAELKENLKGTLFFGKGQDDGTDDIPQRVAALERRIRAMRTGERFDE
jgi:hypothetical protein